MCPCRYETDQYVHRISPHDIIRKCIQDYNFKNVLLLLEQPLDSAEECVATLFPLRWMRFLDYVRNDGSVIRVLRSPILLTQPELTQHYTYAVFRGGTVSTA
jgi:hypothetical protein